MTSKIDTPAPLVVGAPPQNPDDIKAWFRATFGEMPAPTADMDAGSADSGRWRRQEATEALERTLPTTYKWARFSSPELAARVGPAVSRALADALWRQPRLVFMGKSGSGKTSLAVACLWRWVAECGRTAGFFHALALGHARIQHPPGRGEPELVQNAMKWPLALIDDLGSERGMVGCAVPDVVFLRHAEDRPLWVTTGLTRQQIEGRYGAGVARRVFERATVIAMGS